MNSAFLPYATEAPTRAEVDELPGLTLLEFGVDGCPHCQLAQAAISTALSKAPIRHLKVEDGPGRPLGRSFRVKLWPTLILLHEGVELSRLVRPTATSALIEWLSAGTAHGV